MCIRDSTHTHTHEYETGSGWHVQINQKLHMTPMDTLCETQQGEVDHDAAAAQ